MQLTPEQLKKVDHIPTIEVESDLAEAKLELHGYQVVYDAIESAGVNPTNKVQYYMLSAKIAKGKKFIDELNQIIAYRKTV